MCTPCKEGTFNQDERGHCKHCPPFTSSRRHEEESPIFTDGHTKHQLSAATHCILDSELHVLKTGQIYKAEHFSARKLCDKQNFMANSNLCAGENIIGPISDRQHLTQDESDIYPSIFYHR